MQKTCVFAVLFLIGIAPPLRAESPPAGKPPREAILGHWLATLKIQGVTLRLAATIRAEPDGSLKGTLNSLDQNGVDYPLDEVSLQEMKLRLVLKISGLVYEGTLNAAGTGISGRLKQRGASLPLDFKKVDQAPVGRKRPQEPKRPFPYKEEAVTFENASAHAKFAGTLTLPRTAGPFPAVLLITGSGQQDRDETVFGHRPFLVLSDYLTRHGIAALRVDDRGVGGSTGDVTNATSEDFASDVLAGIAYLKSRAEIDPHRIGLVGHSEGGIIASMVAGRSSDVAFIVLLAGTGLPGAQISNLQMAALMKQAGFPASLIAKTRTFQDKLYAAVEHESDPAALRRKIKQAFDEYRASLTDDEQKKAGVAAGAADVTTKVIGSPWFRFYLTYDPRSALRQVRCPVLALIGEKDIQVPPKENLPEIEKALRTGANKDYVVKELPRLNHLFQTCQTGNIDEYARIEETFAPSALELIADWISRHTR
ncbi:MAG TPA: alpha/beta fold hydrolase [Planctomycetaceae bacterium]|jgi:pimeloyl-ACP methyl ester carboxylesterase|nr:alpha/beta fold hydrolase [Planctomycetaceae bacterium]